MSLYNDLTTLTDVRSTFIGDTNTGQDTLFTDLIKSTSKEIEDLSGRRFVPTVETQLHDTPIKNPRCLKMQKDLLEVTTLTNGDGNTIASTDYFIRPNNFYPKNEIYLKMSSPVAFLPSLPTGDTMQAITLVGIFGYHEDYLNAWLDNSCVLAAAITLTAATSFTCTTGKVRAGDILKIDSEFIYASSVATAASDTVTCVRGINGSTAATHLISATVSRWYQPQVEMLCRVAVVGYEKTKNNPTSDTINVNGYSFITPKDVSEFIKRRLRSLGLVRYV